jgi:predicted GNAT family N-acyltransferase
MTLKEVCYNELQDFDFTLYVPDEGQRLLLAFNETDVPIGYISLLGRSIEGIEIFKDHYGNNYGKQLMSITIELLFYKYNYITLVPIEQWLVTYYEQFGFVQTTKYENHLSEFPIMELRR